MDFRSASVKAISFCLSLFLSFFLLARRRILMVIQPMRFIDNGTTVPQVLKASPPLSTLSSSPRSRGMHPIIGTLSVSPRGDNDALSLSPDLFLFPLPLFCATLLFLLSGSQSLAKNLIYPLCSARYPVKGEPRDREKVSAGDRAKKQTN